MEANKRRNIGAEEGGEVDARRSQVESHRLHHVSYYFYIPVVKNCGPSADSVLSAAHRESALLAPGGVVPDRKGGE